MFKFLIDRFIETPKNEGISIFKPVLIILAFSTLIFSIGYTLRPVSSIIDEFHDSDDDSEN